VEAAMQRTVRILLESVLILLTLAALAHAGGPRWVAGSAYFNPAANGQPIVWANGQIAYYTDQGSLSSSVNQSQANQMIAAAVAVWRAIPTAGVNIARAGSLAENVDGSNVTDGPNGVTYPADLDSTDLARPVAIVYDEDGSVIDAFYGGGASSPSTCQQDGVFTTIDNLSVAGNIVHALMIVNGLCAASAANIAVLQYQLVRGFGRILGLDWSQANEEMFVGDQITAGGLSGWPVMHPMERLCSSSGQTCLPNGTTLRFDDIAALNRLYPVTGANLPSFPGKQLTAVHTISIHGTLEFKHGQGMQGVNVVLRPLSADNGLPDIRDTVTAITGAGFRGNAGNVVTGFTDAQGNPLTRFGSDDPAQEGYFDLSGIPLPPGASSASYQLTFEAVDPLYTGQMSVGAYTTGQVAPSGTMPTEYLPDLGAGATIERTIVVGDSADESLSGNDGTQQSPVTVSPSGEWTARISGYGHVSWIEWWARGNREFTVETTALDENGQPTITKAALVSGLWNGTDDGGGLPVTGTPEAFNGPVLGLTTLSVLALADSEVRLGIADQRGDGRPDYVYRGRVLYADAVQPASLPAGGGPILITGLGFRPNSVVTVDGAAAVITSVSPTEITAVAPPSASASASVLVEVQDPETLGVAIIADGLSYGAANGDTIGIVSAPSGFVPTGQPLAFTVRALNWTTQKPAVDAAITYTVSAGQASLGCGLATCTAITTSDGTATIYVNPASAAASVTASLGNGASVTASFTGSLAELLTVVSGGAQSIPAGQTFAPVTLQLTDSVGNPVANTTISVYETLDAWTAPCPAQGACPPAPLLARRTLSLTTSAYGEGTFSPLSAPSQSTRLYITAVSGSAAGLNLELDSNP
jgi:hypothetical protein